MAMSDSQQLDADLSARLRAYYERTLPGRAQSIAGFRRLAAGWECEVFAFDLLDGRDRAQPLVLRLYTGPEARGKAEHEFGVMRYLQGVGYPVPHVYLLELDSAVLGRPFVIMDRVDGELLSPVMHRAPFARKRELIARFVQLLVDLHSLDWRPLAPGLGPEDERNLVVTFLEQMRGIVSQLGVREADPVLIWLDAHAREVGEIRPALVHLDYHMNNLLVRPDGSVAVLDWTGGQVQDRRADLGWTLLLMGMYDGWAMREALLGEYRRLAPWPVEAVEYFETLAAARRLFSMLVILGGEGASLGLDSRAAAQIQANLGHFAGVYTLLAERTGISVPSAERILEVWDGRT